jgi:hypothetical protein
MVVSDCLIKHRLRSSDAERITRELAFADG